ncbi:CDP-diacylglycerol--serine O-phosphatidyltransferase [Planctomycetota bacterium]
MRKIAVLPSLLTLGNLVCGFHAIRYAADAEFTTAAWMIVLAMVFDALDGKVARLTKASSQFGAELDSLADVVSFGIAPAFMVAMLTLSVQSDYQRLVWLCCMVYAVCAALRLARFNVETGLDDESHKFFRGLPSPAAAGQVVSLVVLHHYLYNRFQIDIVRHVIPGVTFIAGVLMVSRIRYPHVVNIYLGGHHAFADVVFLAIAALLIATIKELTLAACFSLFTILGLVNTVRLMLTSKAEEEEPIF